MYLFIKQCSFVLAEVCEVCHSSMVYDFDGFLD